MANPFKKFARWVKRKLANNPPVQPVHAPPIQHEAPEPDDPGDAPSGLPSLSQLPTDQELKRHVTAYNNARYFHVTRGVNVNSILKSGLDPNYGGSETGATQTTNQTALLESVQKKVHVGGDRATAKYYERLLGDHNPERLRVFVSPDEKSVLHEDMQDSDNYAYWTTQHLQSNIILKGRFSHQDLSSLRHVFSVVRMYYPKNPEPPPVDTIIQWHFVAMKQGLLSYEIQRGYGGRHNSF